ncbi:MAG TPA: exodeoxyribonuclease III [Deinococcales bacterium]|nr:exodeoxyribonuclease III [Deinococcales bacterium]
MRVLTINLNGVRAAHSKGLAVHLAEQQADLICMQEVRARETQVPPELAPPGHGAYWHCAERAGYSGVGIYSRHAPRAVTCGMARPEFDVEGRVLRADFENLTVESVYVPSGSARPDRQAFKMTFLTEFLKHAAGLAASGREVLLCGDFNIAHTKLDLKNWRANQDYSGFLPEERAWVDELLAAGFVDVHRSLMGPEGVAYTWWSNLGRARANDVGWRIDYHLATPGLAATARQAQVYRDAFFSDHAPLTVDYDWDLS